MATSKELKQLWKEIKVVIKAHKKTGLHMVDLIQMYNDYAKNGGQKYLDLEKYLKYVKPKGDRGKGKYNGICR